MRSSMAHLVALARRIIGDTDASPRFSDDDIQQALDLRREEVFRETVVSPQPGPPYTVFRSEWGFWEKDAIFEDASQNPVAPVSPADDDYLIGRWVFPAQQQAALYISGKRYDVYGAAADLLERWATEMAQGVDFSLGGDRFEVGKRAERMLALAAQFRARSWSSIGAGVLSRGDSVA